MKKWFALTVCDENLSQTREHHRPKPQLVCLLFNISTTFCNQQNVWLKDQQRPSKCTQLTQILQQKVVGENTLSFEKYPELKVTLMNPILPNCFSKIRFLYFDADTDFLPLFVTVFLSKTCTTDAQFLHLFPVWETDKLQKVSPQLHKVKTPECHFPGFAPGQTWNPIIYCLFISLDLTR